MVKSRPCSQNVWSAACEAGENSLYMTSRAGVSTAVGASSDGDLVPCRPISSIFDEYNVTWIDFFSLDVEGHEAKVLSTIDWSKTQIGVLIVESSNFMQGHSRNVNGVLVPIVEDKDRDNEVFKILKDAGMIHV